MNEQIINDISNELKITKKQVEVTLEMLNEGNTIPFIARYRKEKTNNLNEEQIKVIKDAYLYALEHPKNKKRFIPGKLT